MRPFLLARGAHLRRLVLVALLAALPAAGGGRLAAATAQSDPSAWLFDPQQVNAVELDVGPAGLAALRTDPRSYVAAQITLHDGATTYGPYSVGLKLRGNSSFRDLDGKPALKVKFGKGQEFEGLKTLTLNNMVQDPSMIAEAMSSLMLRAIDVPASRVGYAYVRIDGDDYGLYANVETVDKVMARRWFTSTRHVYQANYTADAIPGGAGLFDVAAGPAKDTGDLDALIAAASGDAAGWSGRMKAVADLDEFARAFAAEHYIGQWDGYSYGSTQAQPNNYDLVSDDSGRFAIVPTGMDQTWLDGENFGLTGNGVLFRECLASDGCQPLYMAALRRIAGSGEVKGLAATARSVREAIAPWRRRDPRREQSVAEGEAQADAKIALMAARPAELASWLGSGPAGGTPKLSPATSARPLLGRPAGKPAAPVAGKRFEFSVPVTRSDTGAPLAAATLACSSTAGVKAVATTVSFEHGLVRLSLTVPQGAAGSTLRVRVEVTAARETAVGVYTYAIR